MHWWDADEDSRSPEMDKAHPEIESADLLTRKSSFTAVDVMIYPGAADELVSVLYQHRTSDSRQGSSK